MENQLILGNCLEKLADIPDGSIDLIAADLPYGTTQNPWDSVIPLEPLWEQYKRVLKPNGAVVLTSQGLFTAKLILSNPENFKYKLVWEKSKATNFLNAKKQPLRKHEDICVFYREQPTYNPQKSPGKPFNKGVRKDQLTGSYGNFDPVEVKSEGERYPTDIIYFKTAESEGPVVHPTQKPVALMEYLIKTYSNEGDTVLDNCCGSATLGIACLNTNRKYILFEKDLDYYETAKKRLAEHQKN